MRIWQKPISIEQLTASHLNTATAHIGLEFLEVGDDFIRARVPVDHRTIQPHGLLHGGVSVVLAETLGSCGAAYSSPAGGRVEAGCHCGRDSQGFVIADLIRNPSRHAEYLDPGSCPG